MFTSKSEHEMRGRGRPPIDDTAVLAATLRLLRKNGVAALTTQAIADEAGVAKASIYRRWPTRAVLLAEAILTELREAAPLDETVAPREAIITHVTKFASGLRGKLGTLLRDVIAACLQDPDARRAFSSLYLRIRRETAIRIIRRGLSDGSFAAGDAEVRHDELYGAIFYRFLFQVGELDASDACTLVDDVLVRPAR